jgi:hypothetical protein
VKVEVFYIDGCPNRQPAVERVTQLLREVDLTGNVVEIPVTDPTSAIAARFLGSPTIHINGIDIEPLARASSQFGVMCRMYLDGSKQEGVPSAALIRRALLEAQSGVHRFATLE